QADQVWPRLCAACGNITYRNPLPVAVVLVPVDAGLLAIRRGIEPQLGKWAFPGGYVDLGESWQEAGAREVFEETGLRISADEIQTFGVHSVVDLGLLIVLGLAGQRRAAVLPDQRDDRAGRPARTRGDGLPAAHRGHDRVLRPAGEAPRLMAPRCRALYTVGRTALRRQPLPPEPLHERQLRPPRHQRR